MDKDAKIKWLKITLFAIIINLVGKFTATYFQLPVWLDMIGTCIAAYYAGTISAVIAGVSNNIVFGFFDKNAFLYVIVSLSVAYLLAFCVKRKYLETFTKAVICTFWIGAWSVIVSTPLNIIFNDGYSGNMWGDALIDMMLWYGFPKTFSVIAGECIVEFIDKQLCILLAYFIVQNIKKAKDKKAIKLNQAKIVSMIMIFAMLSASFMPFISLKAQNKEADNYHMTIYDNSTGMMSSEANVIAETDDGHIWIGSYAGLTCYDGNSFEFIEDGGITNVTYMLNDSKGRLWIGTNDRGIARYENGTFTFFTMEDGLTGNSIRSFVEAEDGSIYVGTTDKLCKIHPDDSITSLDLDIKYVISMIMLDGNLYCVDNNGGIHYIKNDQLISTIVATDNVFNNVIKATSKGILVGTSSDDLYRLDNTDEKIYLTKINQKVIEDIVSIEECSDGRIWVCAEAGFGYIDSDGNFHEQKCSGFDYSFENIHEDYQGNLWIASSRYGVLKLSQSDYINIFSYAAIDSVVVNAVICYEGQYYCGTDNGLVILDGSDYSQITNSLTDELEGIRIRSLMVDSKNRLWICSYGDTGLIRYDSTGEYTNYTTKNSDVTSDRFRCSVEAADGTIVAGTSDGINIFSDDKLVSTITSADGLENSQILTLVQGEDNTIYAGSDGAGIYQISQGKIIANYTTENGLTSDVILRMIPYNDGYFVVTSNSLCYMKDGLISAIENFPYFNNYDVVIKDETAYIPSSAGIYVVNVADLCNKASFEYYLLGYDQGIKQALTANSWNYVDEQHILFCSNGGVLRIPDTSKNISGEYKFGISSVDCDGTTIISKDGSYVIPAKTHRVTIRPYISNYSLSDIQVRFFVEGIDEDINNISYKDIESIQLTNLKYGNYNVHIQIVDNTGNTILQEKVFTLYKEPQIWENTWYTAYLVFGIIEIIAFITIFLFISFNTSKQTRILEEMRRSLEDQVNKQIDEIKVQRAKTEETFLGMVIALSESVDAKDHYTSGHSRRVAMYSKLIAEKMGKSKEECQQIYFAGLLHDVGKIRIPDEIINKPGKLTDEEYSIIKIHPVTGYHILKSISNDKFFAIAAKFHHERYDGKGYPNSLQGTNIPEVARIIGVADSYDAMASNRSYREALPQKVVRSELIKGKGTQFDPYIADLMLEIMEEDTEYVLKQKDITNKKILVVDDEPMNFKMIEFILKDEPTYTVISASSGNEAFTILEGNDIDLILLDVEMPEMNGFDFIEKIQNKYDTSIVFMTADKNRETIQKATDMGVDDYLTKPFLPMALKEVIHSVLKSLQ